jgi:formylglycine-generating enzyme required for sulfatase activity
MSAQDLAEIVEEKKKWFNAVFEGFEYINGGAFNMGALENDPDAQSWEKPQHQVLVSDFYMAKFTITLGQFAEFIAATGYQTDADKDSGSYIWTDSSTEKQAGVNWRCDVKGNPQTDFQHPVIHVSWNDAIHFCNYWSEKLGLKPSYDAPGNLLDGHGQITADLQQVSGFRLPSEAEWEYACRSGTTTLYYTGDQLSPEQANFNNHLGRTQPVGSYPHNPKGLYDMFGNVWEWCQDVFDADFYEKCKKQGQVKNPLNDQNSANRVLRGGSWLSNPKGCRTSSRSLNHPANRVIFAGFRVVLGSSPGR